MIHLGFNESLVKNSQFSNHSLFGRNQFSHLHERYLLCSDITIFTYRSFKIDHLMAELLRAELWINKLEKNVLRPTDNVIGF